MQQMEDNYLEICYIYTHGSNDYGFLDVNLIDRLLCNKKYQLHSASKLAQTL
jgi:hypothetical protein